MNGTRRLKNWLLASSSALVVLLGMAGGARADIYAYATQQLSSFTFTGATVGTLVPGSTTTAVQVGTPSGSESHIGGADALESYVGPGPRPPENFFGQVGQVNPDYARGDTQIANLLPGVSPTLTNVAEAFLHTQGGQSSGIGAWSLSAPFTVSAAGTVTLAFSYSNLLNLVNTSPGNSLASYAFDFNIRDAGNSIVFDSAPNAVNNGASLNSPGSVNIPGSGTLSITSGTLAPGTYTGTISGTERVFLQAVPEPSPLAMGGLTTAVGLAFGWLRRKTVRGMITR
jgi:hypothetical protein